MKQVLIVIGGPIVNMGSQAIIRGLVRNIRALSIPCHIQVMVTDPEIKNGFEIEGVDRFFYRYSIRNDEMNLLRVVNRIYFLFTKKNSIRLKMFQYIQCARKADIVIIVGADNYDRSYNSLKYMNETNEYVNKIGKYKFILYNCSVSEDDLTTDVIADFKRFKYITARDSISYKNIKSVLPDNDVRFFPDVAFCMAPEKVSLPDGWEEGNMIGINLSSLVANGKYGATEDEILNAYYKMIDCILNETNLKICFIPHVKKNADLVMLRKIYDYVTDKTRAILINHEKFNAAQKKYIISNCRLFVGARTHSTIAAYSSMVPTLVIGYSVKSIGIATDLLGTDKGNVIPVSDLRNTGEFLNTFRSFLDREETMRKQLKRVIPEYVKQAEGIQDLLMEMLKS